ncbi:hypothetical protein glysoja_011061 [Glycine soja]|nr:hypothetical protein glysoja_011061 [Glycine soja]
MEAKLVAQCKSPTLSLAHRKPKHPCVVVGVLARPVDEISGEARKTNHVYKDGLFDRITINYLSKCVQEATDFDDMSCEMIFGQDPPESTDDPALKQPCFKLCKAKRSHGTNCLVIN